MEFEFALKVGGINKCWLKKITVGAFFSFFFFKFSRKLIIFGTIEAPTGGEASLLEGACPPFIRLEEARLN